MIRFQNEQNRIENPDTRIIGFRGIKPSAEITGTEARNYWDDIFGKPIESKEIIQTDVERDVYGRDEREFSFDIDVHSAEVREILDRFEKESWDSLIEAEKENIVSDFEKVLGEILDLSELPAIRYYEGHPSDCGCYDPFNNTIWINRNNFDDPQEIADTVAHEMRHAFQLERAERLETYEDSLYAYNFANYISPEETEAGFVNFLDYQDQLIEAEARAFAGMFRIEEVNNE